MINITLYDPTANMNVLGCLIQDSKFLSEIDKYKIEVEDFETKLTKSIFMAISNLHKNGNAKIGILEIEAYLSQVSGIYANFKEKNGQTYLGDAEAIANVENFKYYYNRMKKFSALRDLLKAGYPIKNIYDETISEPKKLREMMMKFDEMNIKEVFDSVVQNYAQIESKYVGAMSGSSGSLADGMRELKHSFSTHPEIGFALQGEIFNTIARGARKKKYYLRSGSTGAGKSRMAMADACSLAYPVRYDLDLEKWIATGQNERTLFITTEMEPDEIQTLALAYLSGVNEEKILYHNYEFGEEERVDRAIEICEKYRETFVWEHIPDPTIEGISAKIRNQVRNNKIEYIFFDYIFTSPSLMKEFSGQGLREDVVLMQLSTRLKDLANELEVFIMSATQLNMGWEGVAKSGIRNQNILRGSKAVADKADFAVITLPVQGEEIDTLEKVIGDKGRIKPTHVTDVYKHRRGRYNKVRIWSKIDLGTCRMIDLFVTDANYNQIDVEIIKYAPNSIGKDDL